MATGDNLQYFDRDNPPAIPQDLFCCPICGEPLIIDDIDEWETESGRVTEAGFYINCSAEPDIDNDDWNEWLNSHWSMTYVDWLPLYEQVYPWFDERYRLRR